MFGLQTVVGQDPHPINHARIARGDLPYNSVADRRVDSICANHNIASCALSILEIHGGDRVILFHADAVGAKVHVVGSHRINK